MHITQDINNGEFDNVLIQSVVGAFINLSTGRAASAVNGGLILGFVFAIILGVPLGAGADAAAQVARALDKDAKEIFWYKVNKYPQPIKKFLQ
ncbi:MAG: hypothetical protein IT294_00430 [Deltaproteobacteria bacterium]|nr:hypothetical protein [Deltaproteobacteria bacterium]